MNFESVVNKLLEKRFGGGFVVESKRLTITAYFGTVKRSWSINLGAVTAKK